MSRSLHVATGTTRAAGRSTIPAVSTGTTTRFAYPRPSRCGSSTRASECRPGQGGVHPGATTVVSLPSAAAQYRAADSGIQRATYDRLVNLPCSVTLAQEQIKRVADVIAASLGSDQRLIAELLGGQP